MHENGVTLSVRRFISDVNIRESAPQFTQSHPHSRTNSSYLPKRIYSYTHRETCIIKMVSGNSLLNDGE